ncbi:uncharacterized protein N0V89_009397 [Didymosphaeria variabile]|uniref:Uncharacterized protein n=1 Tax=Didymosphaeria variabile TaxID=1932322 RepID=A0A9W8XDN8_9PLEO|nr:uncharacterized protein N0V89_009397 [Didymosphaeria variabile]KAJ4348025.1 hypothetical protein N0V89_009397 [Didymosphaeria variabile]
MTCPNCTHQWCWVCLLPWNSFHPGEDDTPGCLMYGDPEYDEEGYENNQRGLHRDTGLNRQGRNRHGDLPLGDQVSSATGTAEFAFNGDLFQLEGQHNGVQVQVQHPDGQDNEVENLSQDNQQHPNDLWSNAPAEEWITGSGCTDNTRSEDDDEQAFAVGPTFLTFEEVECDHDFDFDYRSGYCRFCVWDEADSESYKCSQCGLQSSMSCFENKLQPRRSLEAPPGSIRPVPKVLMEDTLDSSWFNQVSVIQWAEDGEVPYKARKRATWREQPEWLHIDENPFPYFGFGIQEMFQHLESEMHRQNAYVVVEDVGIPGLSMSFNQNNNSFAALSWDEQDSTGSNY